MWLFLSFVSAAKKQIQLAPSGQKIMEEKLTSYPSFDLKKITKEAKDKYPITQEGTKVTLSYRRNQVTGKFYGTTTKSIKIGTKKVPKMDLTQGQLAKFDSEVNEKMRQLYVKRQRAGYNAERMLFEQGLIAPLVKQYPPVSKITFARVFRKMKDRTAAAKYTDEVLDQYDKSLPLPENVSKKQFLKKTLNDFLAKHNDLALDGYYVISAVEQKHKEEVRKKIEAVRQKKLAERIAYPRVSTPTFTPDGGAYDPENQVSITCPTKDAVIRYTINNETPTESSAIYTKPIKLKMNQRLKAIAFHPEYNDSDCAYMASWDGSGLYAAYFERTTFSGKTVVKLDKQVFFDWAKDKIPDGIPKDYYSALWTGHVIPPKTGEYTIYLQGDDGVRMWINGRLFIDGWVEQARKEYKETASLTAGKKYDIKLALAEMRGTSSIMLEWSSDSISRQAIPSNCFFPRGKETDKLRKWNKKRGDKYINRGKMTNPGSHRNRVLLKKYGNPHSEKKARAQLRAGY